MSARIRRRSIEVSLTLLCAVSGGLGLPSSREFPVVVVRGRFVCTEPAGERECPSERIGIRTSDGRVHLFLPADPALALFADSRLRVEELQVTALRQAGDRLQSIRVRLVRGGQVFDIAYVCDVCQITASVPGVCPCCQAELVRREIPSAP